MVVTYGNGKRKSVRFTTAAGHKKHYVQGKN